jgi:hypothetical protein
MKYILILLIIVATISCKSQGKVEEKRTENYVKEELTNVEIDIINTFLNIELEKDQYKKYNNYELFVIEEALKKTKAIDTYLYSLEEWNTMNKINTQKDEKNQYFLDSIKINKIKKEIIKKDDYYWKKTDFKNIKVTILKHEEFRKMINSRSTKREPYIGILYLSRPLIIDKNTAFISFEIGNFQAVYFSTNHFTVLMKKINNKWDLDTYYYDGVFN